MEWKKKQWEKILDKETKCRELIWGNLQPNLGQEA